MNDTNPPPTTTPSVLRRSTRLRGENPVSMPDDGSSSTGSSIPPTADRVNPTNHNASTMMANPTGFRSSTLNDRQAYSSSAVEENINGHLEMAPNSIQADWNVTGNAVRLSSSNNHDDTIRNNPSNADVNTRGFNDSVPLNNQLFVNISRNTMQRNNRSIRPHNRITIRHGNMPPNMRANASILINNNRNVNSAHSNSPNENNSVPVETNYTGTESNLIVQINHVRQRNARAQVRPIVTLPVHTDGGRSNTPLFSSRFSPLNALEPQPLPPNAYAEMSENQVEEKFKCGICLEYLEKPVGCGNCTSRFCEACLTKHTISTGTQQSSCHICPTCRQNFNTMVPDDDLSKILVSDIIHCTNHGCTMTFPRSKAREHDVKLCEFVKVRCPYFEFGCKWTGFRNEVGFHKEDSCELHKIYGLVEHCRRMNQRNERQSAQIYFIHEQLNQAIELVHLQQNSLNNLENETKRCPQNFIDMLEFVIQCAINPIKILQESHVWKEFYKTAEVRSSVYDFLVLTPTLFLFAKFVKLSVKYAEFFDKEIGLLQSILKSLNNGNVFYDNWYFEEKLVSPLIFIFALFTYRMDFFVAQSTFPYRSILSVNPNASSWSFSVKLPLTLEILHPFYDIYIICMSYVYHCLLFSRHDLIRSILMFICLFIVSVAFPSMIAKLMHSATIMPRNTARRELSLNVDLNKECRLYNATLCALVNCVTLTCFGLEVSIYANVLVCLFSQLTTKLERFREDFDVLTGSNAMKPFYRQSPSCFVSVIVFESLFTDLGVKFNYFTSLKDATIIFAAFVSILFLNFATDVGITFFSNAGERIVANFIRSQPNQGNLFVSKFWFVAILILFYA